MKSLFALASPSGRRAHLSILIFHRVVAQVDELFPGEVDAAAFDRICAWLKSWFNVLPFNAAAKLLAEGRLPSRALSITFDDGYSDNEQIALPILQRHGLSATFFIATGFLDGGRMWNDSIIESVRRTRSSSLDMKAWWDGRFDTLDLGTVAARRDAIARVITAVKHLPPAERLARVDQFGQLTACELPADLMMTSDQVRHLHRSGMQIGGHTVNHPILASLEAAEARAEIEDGRRQLQSITGERIDVFAYPNGRPGSDYGPRDVEAVRQCGFDAAVSTAHGAASQGADAFQLPRFTPWRRDRLGFGAQLFRNVITA